jgi:hypothetical protein
LKNETIKLTRNFRTVCRRRKRRRSTPTCWHSSRADELSDALNALIGKRDKVPRVLGQVTPFLVITFARFSRDNFRQRLALPFESGDPIADQYSVAVRSNIIAKVIPPGTVGSAIALIRMGFQAVSAGHNSSLILFWSPWMSLYFICFSCPIDFRHFLDSNPEALSWRTTKAGCGMSSLDRIGRSDKRISMARGVGAIIEDVLGFLH